MSRLDPGKNHFLDLFDVSPAEFAMVGNSQKSDIAPVLALGGWGIHVPYPLVWALDRAEKLAGMARWRGRKAEEPEAA